MAEGFIVPIHATRIRALVTCSLLQMSIFVVTIGRIDSTRQKHMVFDKCGRETRPPANSYFSLPETSFNDLKNRDCVPCCCFSSTIICGGVECPFSWKQLHSSARHCRPCRTDSRRRRSHRRCASAASHLRRAKYVQTLDLLLQPEFH